MESLVFLITITACWVQTVMPTCNSAAAFIFSPITIYVGETVELG